MQVLRVVRYRGAREQQPAIGLYLQKRTERGSFRVVGSLGLVYYEPRPVDREEGGGVRGGTTSTSTSASTSASRAGGSRGQRRECSDHDVKVGGKALRGEFGPEISPQEFRVVEEHAPPAPCAKAVERFEVVFPLAQHRARAHDKRRARRHVGRKSGCGEDDAGRNQGFPKTHLSDEQSALHWARFVHGTPKDFSDYLFLDVSQAERFVGAIEDFNE